MEKGYFLDKIHQSQTFCQTMFEIWLNYPFFKQFIQIHQNYQHYICYFWFITTDTNYRPSQNLPSLNLLAANTATKITLKRDWFYWALRNAVESTYTDQNGMESDRMDWMEFMKNTMPPMLTSSLMQIWEK